MINYEIPRTIFERVSHYPKIRDATQNARPDATRLNLPEATPTAARVKQTKAKTSRISCIVNPFQIGRILDFYLL